MKQNRTVFGRMPDGTQVDRITLRGGALSGEIITYGGAGRSLIVPDRDGNPVDVVLGFDTLEDYRNQDKYIGALVGRYANRIGGAKFTLNGQEYFLDANDGKNSLHGGLAGFDQQIWSVDKAAENSVSLSLVSPELEGGYPGTLNVEATYTLLERALVIEYCARSDKDTVCNLTNHSYFNLSGHDSGSVEGQYIKLNAGQYTPVASDLIPTGQLAQVDNTPMDFRNAQKIGARINDAFDQLAIAGGYDHNWVLGFTRVPRKAAWAWSPETGIAMDMMTDLPGVQFYTGNFLNGCPAGKGGAVYGGRHAFCLETQFFPDSPNKPAFPFSALRAGDVFYSKTSYGFSVLDRVEQL